MLQKNNVLINEYLTDFRKKQNCFLLPFLKNKFFKKGNPLFSTYGTKNINKISD